MPYTQISRSGLVDLLAGRLGDTGKQFWSEDELQSYITEALRSWQGLSRAYTQKVNIPTTGDTLFYNLLTRPELAPTVTDRDLISDILWVLQEPFISDWSVFESSGTGQFDYPSITQAVEKRRNEFMLKTGMVTNFLNVVSPDAPGYNLTLPETVIDVRWACWKDLDNNRNICSRLSPGPLTAFSGNYLGTPAIPYDYNVAWNLPGVVTLAPPAADLGTFEYLAVTALTGLDPASSATVLGVPNDFCWIIKWGALFELFSQDGPGADAARASYCKFRWEDGLKFARSSGLAFQGYVNGVPCLVNSLEEFTMGRTNWVNEIGGIEDLAIAGNHLAVAPKAEATPNSIALDTLINFPINETYVQIGAEAQSSVLDYAQHLALVKEGGSGLESTYPLYDNFLKSAAVQNQRLAAADISFNISVGLGVKNRRENLRRSDKSEGDQLNA